MLFLRRALVGVLLSALTLGALGWAFVAVVQAVTAAMGETPVERPAREVVLAVNTVTVKPERVVPRLDAFGTLRSTRTLELRAASAGQIVDLADPFRDGVNVGSGDVLVRVDPAEAEAGLATARVDLADAEADLRDAERGLELAQDDLSVTQEQAVLRGQALTRQNDLQERRVGSASAVETAALDAAQARQAVVSRRQALAQAETRLDQARTALDRSHIALAEAKRLLADTVLTAPFDGVLSDVAAVRGGLVARNDLLARLVDPTALEVSFRVSTAQFSRLTGGDAGLAAHPVSVSLDLDGVELVTGATGLRESPVVGEGQTGRELFARLDTTGGFRPGDIVTVRIDETPLDDVARLPARAVASDGRVLVVGPDERLVEATVEVVRMQGDTVLVRAPDLVGEQVVAVQTPSLGAGIKVRVIGAPEGTEQAAASVSLIELTPERRDALIALVQSDAALPSVDRDRMLSLLANGRVPAGIVRKIEQRQGG